MPPLPSLTFRYRHLGQTYSFSATAPYTEGHQLTAAEAKALNKLRADAIQENMRKSFAAAASNCPDGILPSAVIAEIQQTIDSYDSKFQFRATQEPRRKLDSLTLQAIQIATAQAPDGASPEEIEVLATTIDVLTEARQRLEIQQRVSASSLEDLLT